MIKALFRQACLDELQALKPGNVHIFADGHGITVQDFMESAEVASEAISAQELSLGERIYNAVEATQNAVHTNTNLGIILLCAPLIQAACTPIAASLSEHLKVVLKGTTRHDADLCFKAIALAHPAGLGESALHDVYRPADCTLLEAMQYAASRDLIAKQYVNDFADVFAGFTLYQQLSQQWQRPAWATTGVHLYYMSQFLDSHIVCKYGEIIAKMVQTEAALHYDDFINCYNPKDYLMPLLNFDTALKKRGLNPGTSADLTVAVLLLHQLSIA